MVFPYRIRRENESSASFSICETSLRQPFLFVAKDGNEAGRFRNLTVKRRRWCRVDGTKRRVPEKRTRKVFGRIVGVIFQDMKSRVRWAVNGRFIEKRSQESLLRASRANLILEEGILENLLMICPLERERGSVSLGKFMKIEARDEFCYVGTRGNRNCCRNILKFCRRSFRF